MTDPTQIVRDLYSAFAAGDVPGVLDALAPDVHWTEMAGGPYGGVYTGPDAVLENVFMRFGTEWEDFTAVPREFVSQGDTVVALGTYSGTYSPTGKSFAAPFAHVWKLADGVIASLEQYTDTFVHREPMG
ncbi:SnoaL-like domain protein [Planctomycetes bacterium Pla163]|uniref:SnoaL-like domain protein n=1 Tax=Rohdeia mirabilis TaxID=2528008 RepID=A0A518CX26_9BACT|nr:SnoaL-like domain protein [Planctomycetes bacterium Pla163]